MAHRDIKPANIFLTCRGGMYDFVKVLDFGLVKTIDTDKEARLTAANAVTGTPLYLSPESVAAGYDSVDAALMSMRWCASATSLLTGGPVFTGDSLIEICMKHTQTAPELAVGAFGKPIIGRPGSNCCCAAPRALATTGLPTCRAPCWKLLETCTVTGALDRRNCRRLVD